MLVELENMASQAPFLSETSCAVDAIILGCHTGSRSCEYCRGTTRKGEAFATVPKNPFTREWADTPIALISRDIQFLDDNHCAIDHTSPKVEDRAKYVQITFRFDKGGGRNFNCRTFKRMDAQPFLCPVRALFRILRRWSSLGSDKNFPICCFLTNKSTAAVISGQSITNFIRTAVTLAYKDTNHLYRKNIHLFRSHSLRVFACCALVECGIREEVIEHRLRWSSKAWRGYIRESLHEVDKAALRLFQTGHTDIAITSAQAS